MTVAILLFVGGFVLGVLAILIALALTAAGIDDHVIDWCFFAGFTGLAIAAVGVLVFALLWVVSWS